MNKEFLNNLDEYIAAHRYRLVNAVVVYQNDKLIFERYYNNFDANSRNNLKSVWKSILSLTLGICLDRGYIKDIDEPISNYLVPFKLNIHPYHKLITIRHLLTMSSGIYWNGGVHYHCPMMEQMRRSQNWIDYIADVQMQNVPGTKFVYKEWDVILLSAVIGKTCHGLAWDICYDYLYKDLKIASGRWPRTKCGVNYTILANEKDSDLSAHDLAKIGLLMLYGGKWKGEQIISREYVKAATSPSKANPEYGYLFWLSNKGFHGRGFGGQELNVYPDENAVVVIQATPTPSGKSYGDISENIINT